MKLHSKFTKYLVENHPLLFHSKFFHLLGAGILMWLFSFAIGYLITTVSVLRNSSIGYYYFESFFVMFHVIACIVILSIWAIHFYKMKPVRNYYPLQKLYFTKLFLQLIFPLFLLVSAYIPFHSGVVQRTKHLLPKEEFREDKRKVNLGYPFLITDHDNFSFSNKAYPKPFPLTSYKLYSGEDTKYEYSQKLYGPNLVGKEYVSEMELFKDASPIGKYLYANDSAFKLNNTKYVFYKAQMIYTSKDSCDKNKIIQEFIELPNELKKKIKGNSLQNFSRAYLANYSENTTQFSYYGSGFLDDYYESSDELNIDTLFLERDYPQLYELVERKDYEAIDRYLLGLIEVANKYNVGVRLNTELLINYWKEKEFSDFEYDLVATYDKNRTGIDYDYYPSHDYDENLVDLSPTEKEIFKELMFVELSQFSRMNSNFKEAYFSKESTDIVYVFFIMAFFFTSFILWFEFMEVKPFLISIPVGGVITIVIFLIMMGLNNPFSMSNNTNQAILFVMLVGLVVACLGFILSKTANRFIASISMNIAYLLSHFLVWIMLVMINESSSTYIIDTSNNCKNELYFQLIPWIEHPFYFLLFGVLSMFLFYKLIPIWKAKKE